MKTWVSVILGLCVALSALGCAQEISDEGGDKGFVGQCRLNSDCASGQICDRGACIADPAPGGGPECSRNNDCRSSEVCLDGECVDNSPQVECRLNSDCASGQICDRAQCIPDPNPAGEPECARNSDCRSDEACTNGECVDNGPQAECRLNSDCASGQICSGAMCLSDPNPGEETECSRNHDCYTDEVCLDGECVYAGEDTKPDNGDFYAGWDDAADDYNAEVQAYLEATLDMEQFALALNQLYILPVDLGLFHTECGEENAFYNPNNQSVSMCYEMFGFIIALFYQTDLTPEQASQEALNTWLFILLHELGHALVDVYDLPITGREEDAVDDFSTVILVNEGLADAAISASLFWYLLDISGSGDLQFADEHSLNLQRFYNILCIVYGSDPDTYADLVTYFPEFEARAPRCPGEYQQKSEAWNRLLTPWRQ